MSTKDHKTNDHKQPFRESEKTRRDDVVKKHDESRPSHRSDVSNTRPPPDRDQDKDKDQK